MKKTIIFLISFIIFIFPSLRILEAHAASGDIGSVVALRGNAAIDRDANVFAAKLKEGIQLKDTVETKERSRVKMLFIDDSVLTVGEKTRMAITEFVYRKDKSGNSIFNLIDGKMRSVVGRPGFEVRTPTLVASARGTVFDCEVGHTGEKAYTTCTSYEGIVDIRSIDPTIKGRVMLRPGMTITVVSGQSLPAPVPAVGQRGTAAWTAGPAALSLVQGPSINLTPPMKGTAPVPPSSPTGSISVGW
jgi:hypothetical protein